MKELDLIKLGFIRNDVSAEESGSNEFYYLTYEFVDRGFCLITNSNDDGLNFHVEIFDEEEFKFTNIEDVKQLINILKRNLK